MARYKINYLWLLLFYDAKFKASASLDLVVIERAESSNKQHSSLSFGSERIQRILLRKLNILLSDPETIRVFRSQGWSSTQAGTSPCFRSRCRTCHHTRSDTKVCGPQCSFTISPLFCSLYFPPGLLLSKRPGTGYMLIGVSVFSFYSAEHNKQVQKFNNLI